MNKFKLFNNHVEPVRRIESEAKAAKRDQIELTSILEKCTQILREDRIWIRNKLKEKDTDILNIFKKYKKPLNLQQLQINLRKHVNKIKEQIKQEQLVRFKENLCLGSCQCENKQEHSYKVSDRNSKSREKKSQSSYSSNNLGRTKQVMKEDNFLNRDKELKYDKQIKYDNKYDNQRNTSKTKMLDGVDFPETIHEVEENDKMSSYRSQFEDRQRQNFFEEMKMKNNWFKEEDEKTHQPQILQSLYVSNNRKQEEPHTYVGKYNGQMENLVQSIKKDSLKNESKYSSSPFYNDFIEKSSERKPFSYEPTFSLTKFDDKPLTITSNQKPLVFENTYTFVDSVSKPREQTYTKMSSNDGLFTNPELLMECRKIIENESSKKSVQDYSMHKSQKYLTFDHNKPVIDYEYNNLFSHNRESPFKVNHDIMESSVSKDPFKFSSLAVSFDNIPEPKKESIRSLYAEDIFDMLLRSLKPDEVVMSGERYREFIMNNFNKYQNYGVLLSDKRSVNLSDVGVLLEKNATAKPNRAREIYRLIDIDRKGYFEVQDYEMFLEQVINMNDKGADQLVNLASVVFDLADMLDNKQVDYWGLYRIKEQKPFKQFSEYLEQFEFEIEN